MSKPMGEPALTGPTGFAVLWTSMFPVLQLMVAVEVLLASTSAGSLVALTVAVLVIVEHAANGVVSVRWMTIAASAGAISPKLQLSTSGLGAVSIAQKVLSSLQTIPAGRGSVRVTAVAVPKPML